KVDCVDYISHLTVLTSLSLARAHESLTYDAQKAWRPAVHRSLTWISHRGRTAERPRLCLAEHRDSKRRMHHLRKNIAVEEALAPSGVQVRKRFARRYFGGRFAGGLQFLNTIARPT